MELYGNPGYQVYVKGPVGRITHEMRMRSLTIVVRALIRTPNRLRGFVHGSRMWVSVMSATYQSLTFRKGRLSGFRLLRSNRT